MAQLARAPALQAGGHRFESDYLHQQKRHSVVFLFQYCGFDVCFRTLLTLSKPMTLGHRWRPSLELVGGVLPCFDCESDYLHQQKRHSVVFLFQYCGFDVCFRTLLTLSKPMTITHSCMFLFCVLKYRCLHIYEHWREYGKKT